MGGVALGWRTREYPFVGLGFHGPGGGHPLSFCLCPYNRVFSKYLFSPLGPGGLSNCLGERIKLQENTEAGHLSLAWDPESHLYWETRRAQVSHKGYRGGTVS